MPHILIGELTVRNKILLEIINEHLPYEIDMFRSAYRQLAAFSKVKPVPETSEQKVLRFALMESFCVHAMSLIDFFANRRTDPTDAVASDFTDGFTASIDPSKQPIRTLRVKLNKQLFPLLENRIPNVADQFDVGSDGARISQEIEPAIERFTASLTADFRNFKCETEPLRFLPVSEFATSTTSFADISVVPDLPRQHDR
jgi:hypothetical protein